MAAIIAMGAFGYADEAGLIGRPAPLSGDGPGPYLFVSVAAVITAPPQGSSQLNMTVLNSASLPIARVWVTNATDVPGATAIGLSYDGNLVSPVNVLPVGATATGSIPVWNVTAGMNYNLVIIVLFQNQGDAAETVPVVAIT